MRPSEPIVDYLSTPERELNLVRREVEDHLREAAAAEPVGDETERQCRALVRFGKPKEIASQYVIVSLLQQSRRTAALLVLVTAAIFAVMKGRGWWYEASHWTLSDQLAATAVHAPGRWVARLLYLRQLTDLMRRRKGSESCQNPTLRSAGRHASREDR
jgi:hypothetical protein